MNTLIAIIFKHEEDGAEKTLQKLRELESEYLIDMEDAVIAHRRKDGKIKLTQSVNLASAGALHGAFWGMLIGFLFTGPLGWLVVGGVGAGFGALAGYSTDYGINDDFMKDLSKELEPCCSALFILVRQMTEDKVIDELKGVGGTIIKTSLPKDVEEKIQTALQENKKTAA
ncbi:MAG: hypothetical protein CMH31_05565 [Micavibrio sp.]|nr:hypothetical protein [Micavibrio sp.]|tara:strand:+ start:398 stop:910 length:513 start_codon:yes stop_codon:yes gene_type:complete